MQMINSTICALIRTDAINRIGATEHMLDDSPPVLWLLILVDLVKARVDRVPSGRRGILIAVPASSARSIWPTYERYVLSEPQTTVP
jgi:hypothetical protein